jgi:hypothetical protein
MRRHAIMGTDVLSNTCSYVKRSDEPRPGQEGALTDSGGAVFPSVMSDPLALDNPVATVLVFGPLVGSLVAKAVPDAALPGPA